MDHRKEIFRAVDRLFNDIDQPASDTLDILEHIREHVQSYIAALEDDGVKSSEH